MDSQICYCGKLGKLTCSWIDSNLGRRFLRCERYGKMGTCGYFVWVDPPMCARSKVLILGLIRSMGRLQAQVKRDNKIKKFLVMALICSWVLWIYVVAMDLVT